MKTISTGGNVLAGSYSFIGQQTKKSVLLIDNTKFNQTCFFNLCSLSDIDTICSDVPLPAPLANMTKNLF